MELGDFILNSQKVFEDEHILLRLMSFDPSSGLCRLAVDEKHSKVGLYYIFVRFGSGDETRIDYDGGNPMRDTRPIANSSHRNDTVTSVNAKRVRD
jgi:hypothetical protein